MALPDAWIANSSSGLWRWWEMSWRWAPGHRQELIELSHATRHLVMELSSQLPPEEPQASPYPLWPLFIGLPSTGLAFPVHCLHLIRLQRARDTTAFLVDPTGTYTTENGVCADALETHGTRVFARLLKHYEILNYHANTWDHSKPDRGLRYKNFSDIAELV